MKSHLAPETTLPADAQSARLVGRAWLPGPQAGPSVIAVKDGDVFDITRHAATMSDLIDAQDPVAVFESKGEKIGTVADLLANSAHGQVDVKRPYLLAPVDLQAIKASGVTFVKSMLERVIEEQAAGDPGKAADIRARIVEIIGSDLSRIVPGSDAAARLKTHLIAQGVWSQYLEVGIGPDAEIFTKAPPMSAVGTGAGIGIRPDSSWNNPEPELVMVIDSRGEIKGAALGNDVNLRDIEGRSALLLGKAKDNNASAAIGPFIRLLDDRLTLDHLRNMSISLTVAGAEDGFELTGASSMSEISRDILHLIDQTMGKTHQYPDGLVLFAGTMFAPVEDRDRPGQGFSHKIGDIVKISSLELGTLVNQVSYCPDLPPWTFGARALMKNLSARGLL